MLPSLKLSSSFAIVSLLLGGDPSLAWLQHHNLSLCGISNSRTILQYRFKPDRQHNLPICGRDCRTFLQYRINPEDNPSEKDQPNILRSVRQGEEEDISKLVQSVNYFISRKCNYSCKFCFHTAKTSHHFPVEQGKAGLKLLRDAGSQKINFAGGEPFLNPHLLGELCRFSSKDLGMAVSIISNGSLITKEWMQEYGRYVDVLGLSVDSFSDVTNAAIGRGETTTTNVSGTSAVYGSTANSQKQNKHVDRVLRVRDMCSQHDILFKLNTVVCSLNWKEDMNIPIQKLNPHRWKVFQVLLLEDENTPGPNADVTNLRDARPLVVTKQQFDDFVQRHSSIKQLVPESNEAMQNSYLLLDEEMRFLDCSSGSKVPGESILKVGVHRALQQAGFDHAMFEQRGGVYDWKRERK